jgi:outer membrane lipoprotein SlyB
MKKLTRKIITASALALLLFASDGMARTSVDFGRITAVRTVDVASGGAQAAGTLVGGTLGVMSGSGQSRSNRALRGVAGAAVGSRVGAAAGSSTAFEYTVLVGGRTLTMVTEQAGLRVGDCVSIERGALNNIRLEADERCEQQQAAASDSDIQTAYACDAAKRQLLEAETDEEFDRAERRVRLLCN